MAEKRTRDRKEHGKFPCPLCKTPKPCIGHLTEHLKKFHRPVAELGLFSKRDDRLRLSSRQKEKLTKAVPKNRYKSMEYKYSLIEGIVAPESPMVTNNVLSPPGKEVVKPFPPARQPWNLQEYFHSHTENTLNIFKALKGSDKEEFVRHHEYLLLTLRTAAAEVEVATGTESRHPAPAGIKSQPPSAYPTPMPDFPITERAVYEPLTCPPSSSNQNFVAPSPAGECQFPEWLDCEEQD